MLRCYASLLSHPRLRPKGTVEGRDYIQNYDETILDRKHIKQARQQRNRENTQEDKRHRSGNMRKARGSRYMYLRLRGIVIAIHIRVKEVHTS